MGRTFHASIYSGRHSLADIRAARAARIAALRFLELMELAFFEMGDFDMCGGSKKSAPAAPAPAVAQPNPNAVADNSNDTQRQAAVAASTNGTPAPMSTFGSELAVGGS